MPTGPCFICAIEKICFAITGLVGGEGVSGVCQVCVTITVARVQLFPARNQRRNATKLNTLPSSNFRAKTVGSI